MFRDKANITTVLAELESSDKQLEVSKRGNRLAWISGGSGVVIAVPEQAKDISERVKIMSTGLSQAMQEVSLERQQELQL